MLRKSCWNNGGSWPRCVSCNIFAGVNIEVSSTADYLKTQLQHILKNAAHFEHPTRKVNIYVDVEFKSTAGSKQEDSNTNKRVAQQDLVMKAEKKPKPEPRPKPNPKEEAKPLDEAQREKLGKVLIAIDKILDQMAKTQSDAQEDAVKELIPERVQREAEMAEVQLNEAKASLNMALAEQWAGDFKSTLREINAAKDEANQKHTKLKKYVMTAKS